MNMKKVTVSRIAKKQIIHHCLMQADRIPVALQRNRLYTTASRPDSSRIAKKQILHHCPMQADRIPVALQRNGLYTTVFCKQTGFQSHCKETDYTPLSFAGRPDSSRIAKKRIIHHCLLQADRIPVALQRNRLYTTVFCRQTGFQSHCKETDYTPFARRLETSTFYHQYINFGSISYINTYLDFSSPFFS
jgi:hypothetical protein